MHAHMTSAGGRNAGTGRLQSIPARSERKGYEEVARSFIQEIELNKQLKPYTAKTLNPKPQKGPLNNEGLALLDQQKTEVLSADSKYQEACLRS